nr:LytTR family DNA-binding domain-containing protein [uncultured Clostridium sp.]
MISMLIYGKDKRELRRMESITREAAARLSDEQWLIKGFQSIEETTEYIDTKPLLDFLCFDITGEGGVAFMEKVRAEYQETLLLLVADITISPMAYMKPGIMAASLLLKPMREEQIRETLYDLVDAYMKKHQKTDEEAFMVETREGKTRIPYHQIYYFEAREKKVYLRTENREFGFYSTLEQLDGQLPDIFVRCHRGFIVHKGKIREVQLSKNVILLEKDVIVPLSRSYKAAVKNLK